ncbi:hypothetical protein M409DRAFT_17008 [Zasmidium cellare ATCC 36951]|uniref:Uncharacterized protein n=1 Tax=Zasmidium cellare ATCC 36951 TaxID=1080233 RepID=A0A6A6D3M8_ZASCE|nr:uncharacterized protein M409DRAFT_17008 [Zasmidium cellare ATCC 36951]KAF2173058.1 hypothetical protein M409DRAFT_17008 [Zasmidium cellare ATCC 36951]
MERAISPSPSSSLDVGKPSAANPQQQQQQRSLVAERRASYRLFPIVEPTPPASPVTLQRVSLGKAAGNHRRRSSSLDHHHVAKDQPSAATGHATSWASALRFRENSSSNNSRKGSLPDILPLRAVKASSGDVSAKLQALPPRPHTAVDRALEGSVGGRSNSVTEASTLGDCSAPTGLEQDRENHAVAGRGLGVNFPHTPALQPGRRVRSRPNLRIAVSADHDHDEQRPPPPPKSPRHARDGSDESQQQHTTPERHHAISNTAHVRDDSDTPSTPSVAQKQALVSLSPTLKVREFTVSPVARGRTVRKETPTKMHELLPSDFLEDKPLPPVIGDTLQPPSSKFKDQTARPVTSEGTNDASTVWPGGSIPPPQRQPPSRPTETRPADQNSNRWSRMMKSSAKSKSTQDLHTRSISPEVHPLASHPVKSDWSDLPSFASRPVQRSTTPEPQATRSDDADITRTVPSRIHLTSRNKSSGSVEQATTDYMPPESLSKAGLALAVAGANVAALRNSNASAGSSGADHRSRSSGSDIGTLSRHPSDGLSRRPSSPGATDPVETLKDLSEQVEALHARYTGLKAERQKISASIIASLKDQKFGPESANLILDEQLSLAAVSSSIDICFAKLKSLECRKEDAIAALIARTTQAQKSPTENISAMIASMALTRKASLAPSDSGSRFAPTGRSTPDLVDSFSSNRLTQPSTRTFSYGSEPETLDYRMSSLSRKHSNGGESIVYAEGVERQTPATIPEDSESPRSQRVSRIHETASDLNQRTSDVSALSPVLEGHPRRSLSEAALHSVDEKERVELVQSSSSATPRDPSPTSERSMSPDELLDERPKKIRVNGSKAAKILGLLGNSADGKDSPLIRLPDEKKAPVKVSEVEVELYDSSKLESLDDTNASLLSVRTKDTEGSIITTDTQASSEPQNLEDQLKSFPRPNPNTLSTHSSDMSDGRRDTGGSFLTNGSSAESSCEPDEAEPPPLNTTRLGRGEKLLSTNKPMTDMRKRDPSAHTIQVYLEHDELLDYYNRMRR